MSALIDGNADYKAVKILRVDWDKHQGDQLITELEIPRRSTLVMFKGGVEVGRVIAQTSAEDIEPMFQAATS